MTTLKDLGRLRQAASYIELSARLIHEERPPDCWGSLHWIEAYLDVLGSGRDSAPVCDARIDAYNATDALAHARYDYTQLYFLLLRSLCHFTGRYTEEQRS